MIRHWRVTACRKVVSSYAWLFQNFGVRRTQLAVVFTSRNQRAFAKWPGSVTDGCRMLLNLDRDSCKSEWRSRRVIQFFRYLLRAVAAASPSDVRLGLGPAVPASMKSGARPLVRPLAQKVLGQCPNQGRSPFKIFNSTARRSLASHQARSRSITSAGRAAAP